MLHPAAPLEAVPLALQGKAQLGVVIRRQDVTQCVSEFLAQLEIRVQQRALRIINNKPSDITGCSHAPGDKVNE